MLRIGSHVSLSGVDMYLGSVKETLANQANALMVYTGAPQNTIRRNINDLKIEEAKELLIKSQIDLNDIVVHAPYIINLANPDQEKRAFAVSFLTKEVIRTDKMLANKIVLHPGSAVGKDRPQAIKWIAEGINQIIENTKGLAVKIALETMAGKGNEVGKTFEEIRSIIDLINDKSRISVCLDTCHIHDAGYDIVDNYEEVIKQFDQVIGLKYLDVIHINDSKNECGAKKDRHENIGFGKIGFETIIKFVYDERFDKIPKILETPYINSQSPYKIEIDMIKSKQFDSNLLESLKNND